MTDKPRVLILGSGFAALETAFLLRMRTHEACEIRLVSDDDQFLFRPNTIYIPFGADPEHFYLDLARPLERRGITLERGAVAGVDPHNKQVALENQRELRYDQLVIATGAGMSAQEVPGLREHAATIWTPQTMLDLGRRFSGAARRRARRPRAARAVPGAAQQQVRRTAV